MARKRYYRRRRKNADWDILLLAGLVVLVLPTALLGGNVLSNGVLVILLFGIIAGAGALLYLVVAGLWRGQRLARLKLAAIDTMSGVAFEKFVGDVLTQKGYHVEYTPASGDFGVDIVARKDGVWTAAQVKRYNKLVKQEAIREAVAGMKRYNCQRSIVVTNSGFTKAAKELARSNDCILVDREVLAAWFSAVND